MAANPRLATISQSQTMNMTAADPVDGGPIRGNRAGLCLRLRGRRSIFPKRIILASIHLTSLLLLVGIGLVPVASANATGRQETQEATQSNRPSANQSADAEISGSANQQQELAGELVTDNRQRPIGKSAEFFPATTIAYAETVSPESLIKRLLEHPLRAKIEAIPQVQQSLKGKEFAALETGLGFFQTFSGMTWQQAMNVAAGNGIAVGYDLPEQGVGMILHSAQPDQLEKLYSTLFQIANLAKSDTVKKGDYRGLEAFIVDEKLFMIPTEKMVFLSDKKPLVKQMVDRFLDQASTASEPNNPASTSLSEDAQFQQQIQALDHAPGQIAWFFANLQVARERELVRPLFRKQAENIGIEILIGGLMDVLQEAPVVLGDLSLTDHHLDVRLLAPFADENISESRRYFFGSPQQRSEFELLNFSDDLISGYSFRDISELWLSKESLFDENHLSDLAQADTTLSTLFSGLDFGEEVLGAIEPGFQWVARKQDFERLATPLPDIRLPEFALVFRLKDPEIGRRFKIAYQSFIGFLNIQLAMDGKPQLELESESVEGGKVVSATYLTEKNASYEGVINYNFSPSIAFSEQWFFVSSTRQMALDMVKTAHAADAFHQPEINTQLNILGQPLVEILRLNAEPLIANNMLEEGNDRDEAEKAIEALFSVVSLLEKNTIELVKRDAAVELKWSLIFAAAGESNE